MTTPMPQATPYDYSPAGDPNLSLESVNPANPANSANSANSANTGPQARLIDRLQSKIHRLESSSRVQDVSVIPSGCRAVDAILPARGYHRGTIVEWIVNPALGNPELGNPELGSCQSQNSTGQNSTAPHRRAPTLNDSGGQGADFLSLLTAKHAAEDGGAIVIADPHHQFYPPAAAALGINLSNIIILRAGAKPWNPGVSPTRSSFATQHDPPPETQDLLWAIDQALRCPAVAAVWGAIDQINERWYRRFQLSAETSGTLGLFVRPPTSLTQPSWSEVQWSIHGQPARSVHRQKSSVERIPATSFRCCQLQLNRCRGGKAGQVLNLQIDTITGNVQGQPAQPPVVSDRSEHETMPLSVASQLAHPTNRRETKRA